MKVLYLPLDSRPCNYVFPVQMARWSGAECAVPPLEMMDHFTKPGNWEAIRGFLEQEMENADALAVSIDQMCYGSLLASRENAVSLTEANARLEFLNRLHEKYPDKPIHAWNVILRSTISTLRLADREVYLAVTAYAESSDRYSLLHAEADRVRMEEAKAQIPPEILEQVNTVRRRNHRVNMRCLEWRKQGVISTLAFLMEDSQPYGFHRKEQRTLMQRMEGVQDTYLHNGADEGGCMGMAKALDAPSISVDVRWTGRPDGRFIAKFEDRQFSANLRDNMYYLGMREDENADIALVISSPPDGQQGDYHEEAYQIEPAALDAMAAEIEQLLSEKKRVYLLDELCANGGCPELLCRIDAGKLAGYSAWNTATNAMGTILGQIVTDALRDAPNVQLRNERFMDDMIYESIIRRSLDRELPAAGEDPYNLKDPEPVERTINERYRTLAGDPAFAGVFSAIREIGDGYMTLPWPRTFEVQAHNR
ncbi:MAG: DUF4127 family protein [Clostridia bacterium]|nr:DUF4127 family protein [Clostridia bacterium]